MAPKISLPILLPTEQLAAFRHRAICSPQFEGFHQSVFLCTPAAGVDPSVPSLREPVLFQPAALHLMCGRIGPLRQAAQPLLAGFWY